MRSTVISGRASAERGLIRWEIHVSWTRGEDYRTLGQTEIAINSCVVSRFLTRNADTDSRRRKTVHTLTICGLF